MSSFRKHGLSRDRSSPISIDGGGSLAGSSFQLFLVTIPLVGRNARHPPGAVVPRTRRRAQRRSPRSGRNEVEEGEALDRSEHAGRLAGKDGALAASTIARVGRGQNDPAPLGRGRRAQRARGGVRVGTTHPRARAPLPNGRGVGVRARRLPAAHGASGGRSDVPRAYPPDALTPAPLPSGRGVLRGESFTSEIASFS